MEEPFANVGDYVMADYGWPHMGKAQGHGCKICKVTKITPTNKVRIAELPTRKENIQQLFGNVTSWDKIVTNHQPETGIKTNLTKPDGTCVDDRKHLSYVVIPESRLDQPFPEKYDSYN